jgi:uncharacterized protein (DUF2236 family)
MQVFGEDLRRKMDSVITELPIGVGVFTVSDQAVVVKQAVGGFTSALFEAVVIVLLVSFVSLGLRAGLVVACSIPLVLAMVFVFMEYSGITFGSTADANWLIDKVRTIHLQVTGTGLDGRPYAASDPELLTWVHVAEVSNFLAAHLRYRNPDLSGEDQDRYYDEIALVAERLGATQVPRSRQQIAEYLDRVRPQLLCDERSHEVIRLLLNAPAPSLLAKPFGALMMQAGIDLLPDWASDQLGLEQRPVTRQLVRTCVNSTAPILRWAVRNGSVQRARRRMGLE